MSKRERNFPPPISPKKLNFILTCLEEGHPVDVIDRKLAARKSHRIAILEKGDESVTMAKAALRTLSCVQSITECSGPAEGQNFDLWVKLNSKELQAMLDQQLMIKGKLPIEIKSSTQGILSQLREIHPDPQTAQEALTRRGIVIINGRTTVAEITRSFLDQVARINAYYLELGIPYTYQSASQR